VLADFELNESWHIVPGVNYGNVEETSLLFIPVMAQYHIANSEIFLQAGPQATLNLEDDPGEFMNTVGVNAGFCVGYEINENFFVEAKYALELKNRFADSVSDIGDDFKLKINTLTVGVGYKF